MHSEHVVHGVYSGHIVHSGRFTLDDRARSILHYLPVDVPPGAQGIEVTLSYDSSAGVLDLGCFGPAGFRGWSGGARDHYAITAAAATPGYLPGELEEGTWQVALGLHRVGPAGVEFEVRARIAGVAVEPPGPPPPTPQRPPPRGLPAPGGMRWLAGDLHAHTVHSDGDRTIDELACLGVEAGLDFLAVSDHNTTSHHPFLAAVSRRHGITLIPAQEVTTDIGHANAFGDIGWIDFRRSAEHWATDTEGRGGLLSINHPLAADCAWRRPMRGRPPLAEVWHWSWLDTRWGGPIAWWQAWGAGSTADRRGDAGALATPVGGSDFHSSREGRPLGVPTTWVLAAADDGAADPDGRCAAVLAGLAAGRTAITADRAAPAVLRLGAEIVVLDAADTLLVDATGQRTAVRGKRFRLDATDRPSSGWYVERHDGGVVALAG
ncbi:MAG: CehA/McbA family metallohydrolase [Mycobacteriales bacterium]